MKALTITQPWAEAIVRLGKDVENRSWMPPRALVGQTIAIHTSKKWDRACDEDLLFVQLRASRALRGIDEMKSDCGHIIGTARIVGVVTEEECTPATAAASPLVLHAQRSVWFFGPVGLVLAERRPLTKVIGPIRGQLGFWNVPAEIEQQIAAELRDAGTPS